MIDIKTAIANLATEFANNVVEVLKTYSLSDLYGEGTKSPETPVRIRRTAEHIENTANRILQYVTSYPNTGAEKIRTVLVINKNEWAASLKVAMQKGLKKKGDKRATVYYRTSTKTTVKKTKPKAKSSKSTMLNGTTPIVSADTTV
jgi:hypothetical protein